MKSLVLDVNVKFTSTDIDAQHRELGDALTHLLREADSGDEQRAAEALEEFIQFLNSYFLFHTFTEEKLMYDNHYPREAYFAHVREHKEVILDMVNLMEGGGGTGQHLRVSANTPRERAHQLVDCFNRWLHHHIEKADSKLLAFLKEKGV